ncbi:MAG: nucleotidyl transferase AbiEii/AbiGii toxin family protein [Treponemataceae bacterium]|nr:nucleotidyl transferase AbiEii/AbiGii toxin family protein [Treponemataceae bacterium]
MTEYSSYYETKLYPIQNEVLKSLSDLKLPFYLTGGTALSRGYYNHRYSDDLDFFANDDKDFLSHAELCIEQLRNSGFKVDVEPSNSDSFSRMYVNRNTNGLNKEGLKIDFVNDVSVHFGSIENTPFFYRTDSVRNILSNKYTAIYRLSIKDVVDICEIAKHNSFNWNEIINEAEQKEAGIDLKEVVQIFKSYDDNSYKSIKWTESPDFKVIRSTVETVAYDMLTLSDNSLCKVRKTLKKSRNKTDFEIER